MKKENKMYRVVGVEETWQGEGILTGVPVLLIRFYGCNLDCFWCDEKIRPEESIQDLDLVSMLSEHKGNRSILLTGGEPLLQIDRALGLAIDLYAFYNNGVVLLETNGTRTLPVDVGENWLITVSPKAETSWDMCQSNRGENCSLKFIVPGGWKTPESLVTEIKDKIHECIWQRQPIILQPEWGKESGFFTWVYAVEELLQIPVCISTQNHKRWAEMPSWRLKDGRI